MYIKDLNIISDTMNMTFIQVLNLHLQMTYNYSPL